MWFRLPRIILLDNNNKISIFFFFCVWLRRRAYGHILAKRISYEYSLAFSPVMLTQKKFKNKNGIQNSVAVDALDYADYYFSDIMNIRLGLSAVR